MRLVYFLLRAPEGTARDIAAALAALEGGVRECEVCRDFSGDPRCPICAQPSRDPHVVLVVEHPQDVAAFERAGEFRGRYHVLHGALSPLEGVGPDELRMDELVRRLDAGGVRELILATSSTVDGDATALYVARLAKTRGIRVTRLASGIPLGGELEYIDQATLGRAVHERREF